MYIIYNVRVCARARVWNVVEYETVDLNFVET